MVIGHEPRRSCLKKAVNVDKQWQLAEERQGNVQELLSYGVHKK